ncbi:MAG TPA: hypothetical protein VGQ79_08655, partial [Nitrospiraceae bacterium]|nr:hypothetical protein [Nitrospiraceae bacterium]
MSTSEKLNVELLSEARTPHGKGRVSARRGRAGEKSDFFGILQNRMSSHQAASPSGWSLKSGANRWS